MVKGKILVLSLSYPTKVNPRAAVFIENQLQFLKKDYDITVINPYPYVPSIKSCNPYRRFSQVSSYELVNGIPVYRPKYFAIPRIALFSPIEYFLLYMEFFFAYAAARKKAREILKQWKFDVIHGHGFFPDGLISYFLKKEFKKPLILTMHGEDVTVFLISFLRRIIARAVAKEADVIICVSDSLRKNIYKHKVTKKRIAIIPSGYNVKRFKPLNKRKCRLHLNLPQDKRIILFVGGLIKRKGLGCLLEALTMLFRKYDDLICCIVGGGKLEERLKDIVTSWNMQHRILFFGDRGPDDIAFFMNACDILVLPSLSEGTPNVVVEALACGKPVVATNVGGTSKIVSNEVGYLVKPQSETQLARAIEATLMRKWDKRKLLLRAKTFSVIKSANNISLIYKKLISSLKKQPN